MVIFGTDAPIESDINLIFQIIIIGLLLYGFWNARRKSFLNHGIIMAMVVILNAISIIWRMIPSFIGTSLGGFLALDLFSAILIVHIILGIVAEIAGIYYVIRWRPSRRVDRCFGAGKQMAILLVMFVLSFLFGVTVYAFY